MRAAVQPASSNISAYKFVAPRRPARVCASACCAARSRALGLKGTILLAPEGINLFLAGAPDAVRELPAAPARRPALRRPARPRKAGPPRSRFGKHAGQAQARDHPHEPSGDPAGRRAARRRSTRRTLKRWLDQGHDDDGRPVVMLDTRNAFEVDHGTFDGAIDWRIAKFSEFPARRCDAHRGELDGKTVVSFCTGGIRCEKAAIYMREAGLRPRVAARRRHPQVLRGSRRRALRRATASCSTNARRWTRTRSGAQAAAP